jgi:acyl-ACP thioesterase
MYQLESKVRYSEMNTKGHLTYHALLNYLQDSSTLHSEELGESGKALFAKNMAWVLSFWQICIEDMPEGSESITVSTWPYQTKGMLGLRNFCMDNEKGERIVKANSIWVLIDPRNGRPVRITDEVASHYIDEPKLEMEYCDRKIAVPSIYEEMPSITVPKYFIDTNNHVNNAKYVMVAEEYLPEEYAVKEIRVEYKKAAVLGDVIIPRVTITEQDTIVVLADEAGTVYAVVQFLSK